MSEAGAFLAVGGAFSAVGILLVVLMLGAG